MGHHWCAAIVWEHKLAIAMRENSDATVAWLAECAPFKTDDWPDRDAVWKHRASWEDTVERAWPWPVPSIVAEQKEKGA